ncbi:uncharacterized protein F4807DRAFT_456072 [Annulohypoxylon truncatum]|uniref:uncharacterized protein n=1 Tax=Annulohypoxylon truncatum TaxID=327061 RepID=UPI0020073400|nr:uncharacterized protein F4807DRAFT_456072 [Annulohypoxylon truncatum]KAI1214430.1 hypothetical protein F4807DRAFT_456072 [Annulohypoxylon truncatum]
MNSSGFAKVATDGAAKAAKWVAENPKSTAAYGVSGVALIAPAIIAGPALAAVGFGANGIAGASLAAGAQASIGNVAAGSLFATLQSAGMAGYGAAIVNGVVQAGGAAAVIATGGTSALKSKLRKRERKHDLVLIENTWAELRSTVKEDLGSDGGDDAQQDGVTVTVTELENAVDQCWVSISPDTIEELKDSVPQQIEAYKKNDGKTEY